MLIKEVEIVIGEWLYGNVRFEGEFMFLWKSGMED
jgi:hypothetical protein